MKEDAAGLAVNIVSIASFPELLQVVCVLHNLSKSKMGEMEEKLKGIGSQASGLLIYFSTVKVL